MHHPRSNIPGARVLCVLVLLATVLGVNGCATFAGSDIPVATPRDEPPGDIHPDLIGEPDDGWVSQGRHVYAVSTLWIPSIKIVADQDEFESPSSLEFDADLSTGEGEALIVRREADDGHTLGLTYLRSRHEERDTDERARAHSATLDLGVRSEFGGEAAVVPFAEASAGIGVAGVDFDGPLDDNFGAAVMGRFAVGLELFDGGTVHVGGGAFLWGYPGETIGRGYFWTLGVTVQF